MADKLNINPNTPEGDGNPGSNGDTTTTTNAKPKETIQHSATADNNYIRRNTKSYKDLSYFIGGIDVTQQNLDQMTPYIPAAATPL